MKVWELCTNQKALLKLHEVHLRVLLSSIQGVHMYAGYVYAYFKEHFQYALMM